MGNMLFANGQWSEVSGLWSAVVWSIVGIQGRLATSAGHRLAVRGTMDVDHGGQRAIRRLGEMAPPWHEPNSLDNRINNTGSDNMISRHVVVGHWV